MGETLISILEKTTEYLRNKKIESPRLNAELLTGHVLNFSRMDLYLNYDRPMSDKELDTLRKLLKERASHIPLQYVIGKAWFRELELKVEENILIPRPETEVLVDYVLKRIKKINKCSIMDFGCGTGAIALSLLKEEHDISVTAVDKNMQALECTKTNAMNNNLESRLELKQAENFDSFSKRFDILVSNPPYIPTKEIDTLTPEVKHEPILALDGGEDGLNFYRMFAKEAPKVLKNKGYMIVEIGYGQQKDIEKIFIASGIWKNLNFYDDLSGITRIFETQLDLQEHNTVPL